MKGGTTFKKSTIKQQIHKKNITLSSSSSSTFGQTHSRLIDKYTSAIRQAKLAEKENGGSGKGVGRESEFSGASEASTLRREIARMSEVVKKYKEENERMSGEHEKLLGKYAIVLGENRDLKNRLKESEEFAGASFDMGRKAMETLPACEQHLATIATCNSIICEQAKRVTSEKMHQALALEEKTIG